MYNPLNEVKSYRPPVDKVLMPLGLTALAALFIANAAADFLPKELDFWGTGESPIDTAVLSVAFGITVFCYALSIYFDRKAYVQKSEDDKNPNSFPQYYKAAQASHVATCIGNTPVWVTAAVIMGLVGHDLEGDVGMKSCFWAFYALLFVVSAGLAMKGWKDSGTVLRESDNEEAKLLAKQGL